MRDQRRAGCVPHVNDGDPVAERQHADKHTPHTLAAVELSAHWQEVAGSDVAQVAGKAADDELQRDERQVAVDVHGAHGVLQCLVQQSARRRTRTTTVHAWQRVV